MIRSQSNVDRTFDENFKVQCGVARKFLEDIEKNGYRIPALQDNELELPITWQCYMVSTLYSPSGNGFGTFQHSSSRLLDFRP